MSNVLVHCGKSTAFRPPNAWLVSVLDALADVLHSTLPLKQKMAHEITRIFEAVAAEPTDFGTGPRRLRKKSHGVSKPHPQSTAAGSSSSSIVGGNGNGNGNGGGSSGCGSPALPRCEGPHEFICEVLWRTVKVTNAAKVLGGVVAPALLLRETVNATARIVEMICRGEVPNAVSTAVGTTKALVTKDFAGDGRESCFVAASTAMAKTLASEVILISCKHTLRQLMSDALAVMLCDLCGHAASELLLGDVAKLLVYDNFDAACIAVARRAEAVAEAEILESVHSGRSERRTHWQEKGAAAPFISETTPQKSPPPRPLTQRQLRVYSDYSDTRIILSTPPLKAAAIEGETEEEEEEEEEKKKEEKEKEAMLREAVTHVKDALTTGKVFSDDSDALIRTDVGSQYLLSLKRLASLCGQLPTDQDIQQLPQSHPLFNLLTEFAQIVVAALHIIHSNSRARLQQLLQRRRRRNRRAALLLLRSTRRARCAGRNGARHTHRNADGTDICSDGDGVGDAMCDADDSGVYSGGDDGVEDEVNDDDDDVYYVKGFKDGTEFTAYTSDDDNTVYNVLSAAAEATSDSGVTTAVVKLTLDSKGIITDAEAYNPEDVDYNDAVKGPVAEKDGNYLLNIDNN